ncbi:MULTISPECIES: TonB-dependent receptor [Pseudoxanthomonas]|uniref:TonB-dependent receptor n=1 Tax=Pseudoxanthomonas TaxID=83618 RepID=UPI00161EA363|nr:MULTISPECIES: TonB-dependent receptor [Pseudoxanthomonas]MBB3277802.1 outer membrane receptor for ferrienterochelin and colicin [Pseudoxanthomonas sp. OG2]MBD9375968.1 TonB-dependent receptor [Pseudoxanthomonas sp. PXM04]MBV7474474.1 TonB-dependent receptor [Pseudoxanthomonas sp. PXM05]UBB25971.1 TonB-dependent receptor [Pseudoxanthomonas japonensis]
MGSSYLSKGIKRTALSLALGACFVGGVQAQSNSAGAITGRAVDGDTITIVSPDTGFTRTINVSGDGSYRFSALPTGKYTITRKAADGASSSRDITVTVGTAANVDFARAAAASGGATTLDAVQVVGTNAINPIDVSSVESTTVLTAEQIAKIPVARNITGVALLAPGTIKGDAAFGNLASFGGSSVSENQYYVNGFNITNTFKNLNFAQIPFEAIAEQQVKTGGYGAEFGRSTGGVINLITKRGSNEFHAGGNIFWEPESLRESTPNLYYRNGRLVSDNSKDLGWAATASVWASGALVKDKLFAYALLQYGRTDEAAYPNVLSGGKNTQEEQKSPSWLVKLDWNITDDHLLALTAFSDKRKTNTAYYYTTFEGDSVKPNRGTYLGTLHEEDGGENYALKYTGYLSENFTLTALAGHGEFSRSNHAIQADGSRISYDGNLNSVVGGCPIVRDNRPSARKDATGIYSGCDFATSLNRSDAKDTRDQFRIDAEWLLGDHVVKFGYDLDDFETVDGTAYSGNYYYQYNNNPNTGNDFVRRINIRQGSTVKVEQRAFYVEDTWNVTDNFLVYGGLRWDSFENKNGLGQSYVKIDNQFAPRLGFSWDVNGDSSFKIFGNAGRFALPLTANVAVRGASASIYEMQDFIYTGVDPVTGVPINMTPGGGPLVEPYYANGETGQNKNPASIASTNLKPMYQDEFILGFQAQITEHLSAGVRGVYRELKRAIDDTCDIRPIEDWAEANGYTDVAVGNPSFPYCRLYNPGSDGIWNIDVDGDGTTERVSIAANALGPEAKRTYSALEFFWEGAWDKFFLQGSYTYGKSKGNTEGGVKSDIGQGDTGTTQDFDYPELMLGSFGYLPNDRRHTLKMFGNWDITDEWSVGGNLLVQSGRPINCFGVYGDDPVGYRAAYFSCDPIGQHGGTTVVDRGTAGRTSWTTTFDLNVAYRPAFADGKLAFKVDVFNVFNADKAIAVNEEGENDAGDPIVQTETYKTPLSWQTPRSVRFMVQYDF